MDTERERIDRGIERAAELIAAGRRVVVFTGAGVSTESGIPDFRGPDGLWSRYDPNDFTIDRFLSSPAAACRLWDLMERAGFGAPARPNPAHYAIAELERMGKLTCVITQNVDNLHQLAGSSAGVVFELHGNMQWARCMGCGNRYSLPGVVALPRPHDEPPRCSACHGVLKPDAVFFGEMLPQEALAASSRHSCNCDVFVVVGSTLVVYPAALMPKYACNAGARLIMVNLSPTPMDGDAAVIIRSKAGEALPRIVERVKQLLAGQQE